MASQFNWKTFSIAALRRASYRTPMRNFALAKARVGRGLYHCAICLTQGIRIEYKRKQVQVDHIEPVVPPTGWEGLDSFAQRLFCPVEGLQCICKPHHQAKSKGENALRNKLKKEKKNVVN